MELSKAIATAAVVLAVILAAAYAVGEEAEPAPKQTAQQKLDQREAERRIALAEQQKRKEHFQRNCDKPLKTATDYDLCRAAYKELVGSQK